MVASSKWGGDQKEVRPGKHEGPPPYRVLLPSEQRIAIVRVTLTSVLRIDLRARAGAAAHVGKSLPQPWREGTESGYRNGGKKMNSNLPVLLVLHYI